MAKRRRSAAQKAATRRMIAARRASLGKGGKARRRKSRRARARRASSPVRRRRRRARRNPTALVVNPGGHMAKRRRRRRKSSRGRVRRRRSRALARINPRKVRRHGRRRRARRNPGGIISGIKLRAIEAMKGGIPAILGGAAANFVDARFLGDRHVVVRLGAKVAASVVLGVAGQKFVGERFGAAAMYGALGTVGGEIGTRLGGGVQAPSVKTAAKQLKEIADEDESALGILQEELSGMGVLEVGGMGDGDDDDAATLPAPTMDDDDFAEAR